MTSQVPQSSTENASKHFPFSVSEVTRRSGIVASIHRRLSRKKGRQDGDSHQN
jgi:hypothetical protein